MISHLKGTVEKIAENSLVIDVNGVGYRVICSARTLHAANDLVNSTALIHVFTELIVREDAWVLYGFISESERFWFGKLTSVQGVGGKAAMAILSALSDEEIYNAFLSSDSKSFTRADGVGPKLASRIVSELKDKIVGKLDTSAFAVSTSTVSAIPGIIGAEVSTNAQGVLIGSSAVVNDVISALVNLGYQKSDIYRIISSIKIADDVEFDVLLRQVLARISNGG